MDSIIWGAGIQVLIIFWLKKKEKKGIAEESICKAEPSQWEFSNGHCWPKISSC